MPNTGEINEWLYQEGEKIDFHKQEAQKKSNSS